jgi:CMP-N-acetylneuraminic acid synthetase
VSENFVVVPARGGSKGILNKNSMKVLGKTLTTRSLIHARCLVSDKNIILSTDSKQIIDEVVDFFGIKSFELILNSITNLGPFKVHYRDSSLSSDLTQISEVLLTIRTLLAKLDKSINVICLLQPTTPFRSIDELKEIGSFISKKGNSDSSLVSVTTVDDFHPARMYSMNANNKLEPLEGFAKYRYNRRQNLPEIFIRDGGFYVIGDTLISLEVQYSDQPNSFPRKYPWTINIDSTKDLILAQNINRSEIKNDPNEF